MNSLKFAIAVKPLTKYPVRIKHDKYTCLENYSANLALLIAKLWDCILYI